MSGIYVHVPWCRAICPYCGFAVVRDDGAVPWERYVDRILVERHQRRQDLPARPATVFLGGGTPSRMPIPFLERLIAGLDPLPGAEITAEVNPEDATDRWLEGALAAGVTRISIGVQTFEGPQARLLGRAHTSAQAHEGMARVRTGGFESWSADLIFAVPGQTIGALERDLAQLLALDPPHVALYGLTFEPDTPFERRRQAGKISPVPDDLWREMYDLLVERLGQAGLLRYEVSNFARTGHRSRHNTAYWRGLPYLGLGPGAHGLSVDGSRWVNLADPAAWMNAEDPAVTREHPSAHERAVDRLVAGMRWVEGVDLEQLGRHTGLAPDPEVIDRLCRHGVLRREGTRVALSSMGFPVADSAITALVERLQPVERSKDGQ